MYGLSFKEIYLIVGQEITPEKIIVTIHGLSVHDLRQGDMEVHGEVLSLLCTQTAQSSFMNKIGGLKRKQTIGYILGSQQEI